MPIFRGRQEELKVLNSFDFGSQIFPCLEIIKEIDRKPPKFKNKEGKLIKAKKDKTFEDSYLPLIERIKAEHVFIDLPVHLKPSKSMKNDTVLFLRKVAAKREIRTNYLKKFSSFSNKIIPVISTYSEITNEIGSIELQEKDIRPSFRIIAFRTFYNTFLRDIKQIKKVAKESDYLIMDWEEMELDLDDGDVQEIVEILKTLNCNIIIHRNPFPKRLTMVGLKHGKVVDSIENNHLDLYKDLGASCFSDYVGIKKDDISDGGTISPGFIFYNAIENNFYGYRFKNGSLKKGEKRPVLAEFETTIVPAVINSDITKLMQDHQFDYLNEVNKGWEMIKNIELGPPDGESGKSQAKFKRISMEHYLHCIKMKIINDQFN